MNKKNTENPRIQTNGHLAITREKLIALLNEDLAREYQAIISYVVYSQMLKGAEYLSIAKTLEQHAREELQHALIVAKQIDYLGGVPGVSPRPVKTSKNAEAMLRFDLDAETETIRNYRERIRQCEVLEEYALAEQLRQIMVQEQDHQIALANALGADVAFIVEAAKTRPRSQEE
ncbi:MAG TPA: ferritin-like domain-containing protein [Gemmataceae bacterium]|nr:ferritin-like domain-containing protein [Gemmataceae bacterium]